ncbi:A/G-specific adenine glycosylase, partial [bacterium]|nr:A/G-specific adenine glycosylase [bacterium]
MTNKKKPLSPAALRRLLKWYRINKRELPWRGTTDPYAIWISEIMLQQTQVKTVKPYYERWMQRFPNVTTLAQAPLDDVLKVWEGCGYYARARNLHRAAVQLVRNDSGQLPESAALLQKLPGIGPYTSAAIASIAFGEAVPVLDGNVERVLCRLLLERRLLKTTAVQKRLRRTAADIMDSLVPSIGTPGELNQAMMEIGANVCTVRTPQCKICPLKSVCRGHQKFADPSVLPRRKKSEPLPHYNIAAAIIKRRGRILITQRPPNAMLGGLWEFPGGKQEKGESLEACLVREIREELAIDIHVGNLFETVKHSYSHFRITLHAFSC